MKKISIFSTALLKAIQSVAPVVRDKNVIPIYDSLLFDIKDGKLTITGANPEVRASTNLEINAKVDFSFCVEKNLIVNILNGLSNKDIQIEFGNNEIIIHSDLGIYNLPTEPSEEYPKQIVDEVESFMVDAEILLDGLKKASPFVDEATENLNGIMIKSIENLLFIVGANHNKFYERQFPYNGDNIELYISTAAARFLVQSFDADDPLSISYNKTFFCISCGGFSVEVTQMNIKFPDYKKILDAIKRNYCFKIDREYFASSIKRFHSICDKDVNTLILAFDKNKVELYFENTLKSFKAKETLDCTYNDKPFKIGFNINFLRSALSCLDAEEIEWYLMEEFKPSVFIEEGTRVLLSPTKFKEPK